MSVLQDKIRAAVQSEFKRAQQVEDAIDFPGISALPSADGITKAIMEAINTPELEDFVAGVALEALHQRERWPPDHDVYKTPADWFWTLGYLAQKALHAHERGDVAKLKHHLITTAALMANWHAIVMEAERG